MVDSTQPKAQLNWPRPKWAMARLRPFCLAVLFGALSLGCAGHSAKTLDAREALDAGRPKEARDIYNKLLHVKSAEDLPQKKRKNNAIFVLDRSLISQQLEDYQASSHDLEYADKAVEMLDMSRTAVSDLGRYVFSDDAGPYKGSPHEKVMINTMNMVNYLVRHDLNGARIEARRLSIIQDYLKKSGHPAASANAPGGYLAGFVFERSGRPDIALRYYDEALSYGSLPSLAGPIAALHEQTPYWTPRLEKFLKEQFPGPRPAPAPLRSVPRPTGGAPAPAPGEPAPSTATLAGGAPLAPSATPNGASPPPPVRGPSTATTQVTPEPTPGAVQANRGAVGASGAARSQGDEDAELLIVVSYGRVPAKIAKRIPIGLALTYATANLTGPNQNTANRLAAQGLVTWVNYPELEETYRRIDQPHVYIDGRRTNLDNAAALDLATRKAYDEARGAIIASAITRTISRVVAGEAAGAAGRAATDDNIIGALISLATQATLTAADTPDTRSWVTLPARMDITRVKLPPGKHRIELTAQGKTKVVEVNLTPGGWEAVALTVLR